MYRQAEKWYLTRQTFPELLHRNVFRFPDRLAQTWRNEKGEVLSLTYSRLGELVKEIASALLAFGLEKGDRVAIAAPNVPEWLWVDYAILCAGGISVAVPSAFASYEVGEQLRDSGSDFVFVYGKTALERIFDSGRKNRLVIWMGPGDIPSLKLDHAKSEIVMDLEKFREKGRAFLRRSPLLYGQRWRGVQLDDPMTIIYTSGTTGQPKGVLHTHFSMTAACIRDLYALPYFDEKDLFLSFLPIAHSFERQCGHAVAMFATMCIAYGSLENLGDDLRFFKPSVIIGVPAIYIDFYRRAKKTLKNRRQRFIFEKAEKFAMKALDYVLERHGSISIEKSNRAWQSLLPLRFRLMASFWDFMVFSVLRNRLGGNLRFVCSASSNLPREISSFYICLGIPIIEGYGSTETCNTVCISNIKALKPGYIGVFAKDVKYKLEEDGELLVKSPYLFSGYWNHPEIDARVFDKDSYFRTGDIVDVSEDGYIRVLDRKKGLIVLSNGQRVASAKIESLFVLSAYIEHLILVGDDKPYVVALIQVNTNNFADMFKQQGLEFDSKDSSSYSRFLSNPDLRMMVDVEITRINEKLNEFEKIRDYILIKEKLSYERGELTSTYKVKKDVVIGLYKDEIKKIYSKKSRFF